MEIEIEQVANGWLVSSGICISDEPRLARQFVPTLEAAFKVIREHAAICEEHARGQTNKR